MSTLEDTRLASMVRILDATGATAGAGFVVHKDGLIATCAHVAAAAGAGPGGTLTLEFVKGKLRFSAVVDSMCWRDPSGEDVALVRLTAPLPSGVVPLALWRATGNASKAFDSYGFPKALAIEGLWGYGVIGNLFSDRGGNLLLQLTQTTEISPGFSGGPVIERASGRVVGMVSSITQPDQHGRLSQTALATPSETLFQICPSLQPSDVCPYRSLEVFDEEHAEFFFGRDRIIEQILLHLRRHPRFLALLGPSGSGKSSLIRAGLMPRLRARALPGSDQWDIFLTRPTDIEQDREQQLPGMSDDLLGAIRTRVQRMVEPPRCILIVDQFEELFTLPQERLHPFIEQFDRLLNSQQPLTVILVMRDDFYSQLAREAPELMNEWVVRSLINIPPRLSVTELTDIIEKPAAIVGLQLEAGLVDMIIDDAIKAAGTGDGATAQNTVLPLLEFALTQLWHQQQDGVLKRNTFREIGGVTGGLAQWADNTYFALPEQTRPIARRILTFLVQLGDEFLGIPNHRKKRELDDLHQLGPAGELDPVLAQLVNARLLVTNRDAQTGQVMVELIHEALLREWVLFHDWLQEDRQFLSWRQSLDYRLRSWAEMRQQGSLTSEDHDWLQGHELDVAHAWLKTRGSDLAPLQREFIVESLNARDTERAHEQSLRNEAERERLEAERLRQVAETRSLIAKLQAEADEARSLLPVEPVHALITAVAAIASNLSSLPGEPLAPVQLSLHTALRDARERLIVRSHSYRVETVAFSPDGQLIASGSGDRTVRLWDLEGHPFGTPFFGHDDFVTAIAFSPDGQLIASGSGDRTVRLWDLEGHAVGTPFFGHDDFVTAIAFSPDGRLIASGSGDRTVRLWDLEGHPVGTPFFGHDDFVTAIAFSPDGHLIASGSGDRTVRLWDLEGHAVGTPFFGHDDFVTAIAFSPDGHLIASGSGDRTVRLWDLEGHAVGTPFFGHDDFVTAAIFNSEGSAIISSSEDRSIRLWDLKGNSILAPLVGHKDTVTAVACSPDSRYIASGSGDQTVRLWDWHARAVSLPAFPLRRTTLAQSEPGLSPIKNHNRQNVLLWDPDGNQVGQAWLGHRDYVADAVFINESRQVVSGGGDRRLIFWDLRGNPIHVISDAHTASITAIAYAATGPEIVASGGRDNVVRLWDLNDKRLVGTLVGHEADVMAVAFSPDGQTIATASRDRTVRLWDLTGAQLGKPLVGHEADVVAITFSPDGQFLATASRDRSARLWKIDGTWTDLHTIRHDEEVNAVAFSPDGQVLGTACRDRMVYLWTVDGKPTGKPFRAHADSVELICFSPDGRVILTGSKDGSLRLWNREGLPIALPWQGHEGGVTAAAFNQDGKFVISCGLDTAVRLWYAGNWETWLHDSCERLRQHPSLAETQQPAIRAVCEICAKF